MFFFACALLVLFFFFFFSSRRRHTRWTGDWSSDVCSSDLVLARRHPPRLPVRYEPVRDSRRRLGAARAARAWRDVRRRRLRLRALARRQRSEERRVGKECRSRWAADHWKKREEEDSRQIRA